MDKLDIPQDDLNLILGGNAIRIMRLAIHKVVQAIYTLETPIEIER